MNQKNHVNDSKNERRGDLFLAAVERRNHARPPVWFMRQAGRYHAHYQAIRKQHSFIEMCKTPELATEVTLGPIQDFGFDAAILFSDLLFPLEEIGMGLHYDPAPRLEWHLVTKSDLNKFHLPNIPVARGMRYQARALELLSQRLPKATGLIGFVGGAWTLFCYAAQGSHKGDLAEARQGLRDGRWFGFLDIIESFLVENMVLQAKAGAQAVAVFDTCAGDLDAVSYAEFVVPSLGRVLAEFKRLMPSTPVIYYSKNTGFEHWRKLKKLQGLFDVLGVDWKTPLNEVFAEFSDEFAIQGNFDPHHLFLPQLLLKQKISEYFASIKKSAKSDQALAGWICGLGHGVLPGTPEASVRLFLQMQREAFL